MSIHLTEAGAHRRCSALLAETRSPRRARDSSGYARLRWRVRRWRLGLWKVEPE